MNKNQPRKRKHRKLTVLFAVLAILVSSGLWTMAEEFGSQIPSRHLIDVPYINQQLLYPTGCESVSAVMALNYLGVNVSAERFIDEWLPKGEVPSMDENGTLRGCDPSEAFPGNPYSDSGWGCTPRVITKALEAGGVTSTYTVEEMYGRSLWSLCTSYVAREIPVILWVTVDMQPISGWNTWVTETGSVVQQPSPLHSMVLVGYDKNCYYFNDPMGKKSMAYPKDLVEKMYTAVGKQAIAIY